jgi:hypothetical protein
MKNTWERRRGRCLHKENSIIVDEVGVFLEGPIIKFHGPDNVRVVNNFFKKNPSSLCPCKLACA